MTSGLAKKATTIHLVGSRVLRYGLVLIIGWIGLMKFTGYEAKGIRPLLAHGPFDDGLGVVEVAIFILIALRSWSPKASALGRALAIPMFLTTLSFIFSSPGGEPSLGGLPTLSAMPGQFQLKDVALLGAAISSLGESLTSPGRRPAPSRNPSSRPD